MKFEEGDMVRIKAGAFAAFTGKVEEVRLYAGRLRVAVNIYGRVQAVELPFQDVEKITFTDESEAGPGDD
jgi:transcription antitermination factor NusG